MTRNIDQDIAALRDAFVDAVLKSDMVTADALGARLLAEFREDGDWPTSACGGTLLREDQVPDAPDWDSDLGLELLEGEIQPERLEELQDGAEPDHGERDLWRRRAAESLLSNSELDWDSYAMYSVYRIEGADGRVAYLATVGGGYSFSNVWDEYVGAGVTADEALAHLKGRGYVSVDDFRERYSPPDIPSAPKARRKRSRTAGAPRGPKQPIARLEQGFADAFPVGQAVSGGTLWLSPTADGVTIPQLLTGAVASLMSDDDPNELTLEGLGVETKLMWRCGCAGDWGNPWWLMKVQLGDRGYLVFQLPDGSEWEHGGVLLGWSPARSRLAEDQAVLHAYRQWGEPLRFPFTVSARSKGDRIEQMVNRPRFRRLAREADGQPPPAPK